MANRRVCVTGIGVVAAPGIGGSAFWKGLRVDPAQGPRRVNAWDPDDYLPRKEHRRLDRFAQFAIVAAEEALAQSGLPAVDPDRFAVAITTSIGGFPALERLVTTSNSSKRVSPILITQMMCNSATAAVSIRHGLRGPTSVPVVACASGTQAIADAYRFIRSDLADAAIAGAAEAPMFQPILDGFASTGAMSASGWARPFDAHRDGFVLGEGAGVLVLEERSVAEQRGVRVIAEIAGSGQTSDGHHVTAPAPNGSGAARAMQLALAAGRIEPQGVGYINAHGTGTRLNDAAEAVAIRTVFADHEPHISSIKGATGHAIGASGAIEAVASVLAIDNREVPPTVGLRTPDSNIGLARLVTHPTKWSPTYVMSSSFAFGGHNSVVLFRTAAD